MGLSLAVTPIFRTKLTKQFLVGARNTAFVTEYVTGMATVKSLQMEPVLERRCGDLLAQYLAAGFETKQLANTYNTVANALEQTMTLAILGEARALMCHRWGGEGVRDGEIAARALR